MSRIRSLDTSPEMTVRRLVHGMGYRYRLHVANLPGKPDMVFPRLKKIIDVRGCFWHCHKNCPQAHVPLSRVEYWGPKLARNQRRDEQNGHKLKKLGWKVLVLWECELNDAGKVSRRVARFLG